RFNMAARPNSSRHTMRQLLPLLIASLAPFAVLHAQTDPSVPAQAQPPQAVPVPPPPQNAQPPSGQAGAGQAAQGAQPAAAVEEDPDWAVTLERIAGSVVSIEIDATRAFDTEWNTSSQATGFVVDAERGLILTNRHVVTPGPVTSEATFLNREEVQLFPV